VTREYGQYCGLARALELVGGRWSLLIVRELLTGPKRFTELAQGLPGIPTNILSSRLRELEDAGLVERALQARPASVVVYELTPYGLELEEPVIRLGLWGAKALGTPKSTDSFSLSALTVALRGTLRADRARDRDLVVEIRFEQRRLVIHVHDGQVSFPTEPSREPQVVLETLPHVFSGLFSGAIDIDAAVASGQARLIGSRREARRFFEMFPLPARRPESEPVEPA
jgi:DNA-binding HxlR family transcriptional regulator/putative sterol carrier protein